MKLKFVPLVSKTKLYYTQFALFLKHDKKKRRVNYICTTFQNWYGQFNLLKRIMSLSQAVSIVVDCFKVRTLSSQKQYKS